MREKFEGHIYNDIPAEWDLLTKENPLMHAAFLSILKKSNPNQFRMVTHSDYCCCEYKMKMNILTFSKMKLNVTMTVIGLPVSICAPGYVGDLQSLIRDYKKRRGLFVILNIPKQPININAAVGETLGNCVFENKWDAFDEYLSAMKSGYRRRINIALKKGETLQWRSVARQDFTDEMYNLYLNVLQKSKYPLECLSIDFFRIFPGEICCLCEKDKPLAFVLLKEEKKKLSFVFGGMDYSKRNQYDLYMNMLVFMIKECIKRKCNIVDLGQTAEDSKMRVGATILRRYLCVFSGNKFISALLKHMVGVFSYEIKRIRHGIWKTTS